MRKIDKGESPVFFEDWKTEFKIEKGKDAIYADLIGEAKQLLKSVLYDEQYGLCCYCCKALSEPYPDSQSVHIEHFRPKGIKRYEHLSLDYPNLHVSCSGVKDHRDNCGHKKDDWFDEVLTVSPQEAGVEKLFEYTIDGHIKASENNLRAETTIQKLGLDSFALQRLRSRAIYMSGLFDQDFDSTRRNQIVHEYSTPENGKLRDFCSAVVYCVEHSPKMSME